MFESYSNVRTRKSKSNVFSVQNGLKKRRCFITDAFEYAITKVQESGERFHLNGTYQLLVLLLSKAFTIFSLSSALYVMVVYVSIEYPQSPMSITACHMHELSCH
jgi:hypothetical protein